MAKGIHLNKGKELFALMGLALTLLHEIEYYFAKALVFGLNERDRKRGRTIGELLESREQMTFGQMVAIWKEEWDLNPLFSRFLDFFVEQRNLFVHKLTQVDGFELHRERDRKRLIRWLTDFIQIEFGACEIFQSAMLASVHFASSLQTPKEGSKKLPQLPDDAIQGIKDLLQLVNYRGPGVDSKPQPNEATYRPPVITTEELTTNLDNFFRSSRLNEEDRMLNYVCRWPNGDISLVIGQTQRDVLEALDEVDDPSKCELIPVQAGALHLKLTDEGEFEYEEASEEIYDAFAKAYPIIDRARGDLINNRIDEGSAEGHKHVIAAVASERRRKLRSHGQDVFEVVYRHIIRRARKEALANPKTPKDVKNLIRKRIKEETKRKLRSKRKGGQKPGQGLNRQRTLVP